MKHAPITHTHEVANMAPVLTKVCRPLDPSVTKALDAAWDRLSHPDTTHTGFTPPWLASYTPVDWCATAADMRGWDDATWDSVTEATVAMHDVQHGAA